MESGQYILQCDEDGMTHVQSSRDVGRGHGEDVGFAIAEGGGGLGLFGVGVEASGGFPPIVDGGFEGGGVVGGVGEAVGFVERVVEGVVFGGGFGLVDGAIVVWSCGTFLWW